MTRARRALRAGRAIGAALALALASACGGAATVAFPDLNDLRTDWGCGYGFARSDPDQTMAVVINREDGPGPDLLATPEVTVQLPDPAWRAEVRAGTDLFSNWCDVVVEPSEPTPRVEHRWSLRSGTLHITLPTLEDAARATGRLTGAVVNVDGVDRPLPALELTNTGWGQFAG